MNEDWDLPDDVLLLAPPDITEAAPLSDVPESPSDRSAPEVAADASAEAQVFKVIGGTDDRKRVTNTTTFPANAVAQLIVTTPDGAKWGATGSFISGRTLLTAAHSLFVHSKDPKRHGPVREIVVVPGRNGTVFPFGAAKTEARYVPQNWISQRSAAHDYGLVFLEASPGVGAMMPVALSDDELRELRVFISGYPLDKPLGTQWVDSRAIRDVSATQLLYGIDTVRGQSGCGVFAFREGAALVVGVHRFGQSQGNLGTRLTPEVLADIQPRVI